MCDKCDVIDYAVADCWRPCYIPRPKPRGWIPTTPVGGFSDEDYDAQLKINQLMAVIRAQRSEILTLKATPRTDSRESFEGIE